MQSGRNFTPRQLPIPENRLGRWVTGDDPIVIGAPVKASGTVNAEGRHVAVLATGAQNKPEPGMGGILWWEGHIEGYWGVDPVLTRDADITTVPANRPVQVWRGQETRALYTNTVDRTIGNGLRTYEGRIMVAGLSIATPTIAVGNLLTPGVGNDTDGYWAETSTDAQGWLVVTNVDSDLDFVEVQLRF